MNILLIGLGSIGKRHLTNILSLGYQHVSVVSRSAKVKQLAENVNGYKTVDEAFHSDQFDAAFVCSPTACHIEQLTAVLHRGVKRVYVEKPLSNSLENLDEVIKLATANSADVIVGYDLHFDPGLERVKILLQQKAVGKVVSANAFVGQYLPQWRPYEDHRKGMSAKKQTGGGVLLDLIHEVDYLYWLFGEAETVACHCINTGELEIETEEAADLLLKFANGVTASLHLDYWQPQLKRYCIFTGTKGTIYWDLAEQRVTVNDHSGKEEKFSYASFSRNDRFKCIVSTFLEKNDDPRLTKLPQAIESLKIVLAAKYAGENECVVKVVSRKS